MGSWSFGYDKLNRLTSATASPGIDQLTNFSWSYDGFGNRTQQYASGPGVSSEQSSTFNSQNQITNAGYTFDGAGNIIYDNRNVYLYDAEGRICAVNSGEYGGMTGYLYDASGNRVAKGNITNWNGTCDITTNGFQQTEGYVVGPSGEQLTEVNASNAWTHTNIYAGGKLIGTYDTAGLHFHIDDPLGTRRMQFSSAGVLEAVYQSLPFGDGYTMYGSGDPTENHFTGKERDTESGNDYFGARSLSEISHSPTDFCVVARGEEHCATVCGAWWRLVPTGLELDFS